MERTRLPALYKPSKDLKILDFVSLFFPLSSYTMSVTDHIRSFTAPEFIVALVSGILYGIGAILMFDKSKRHKFFLPYFYLGAGALLCTLAKVFDIVWDKSEGIQNDFPLHASLLLETIASIFPILALFRLLQVWQQVGLRGGENATRWLSLTAPVIALIAMVICVVGDVILVQQDQAAEEGEEDEAQTHKGLLVKFVGSIINIVLLLTYMGLVIYLAHATGQRRRATITTNTGRSNPNFLVAVLAVLGLLTLIRWTYYLAMVGAMTLSHVLEDETIGWPLFVGLIVVPEIGAMVVAILYDLTRVKNGVEVSSFWVLTCTNRSPVTKPISFCSN
ncbi:hypothetical protein BJV82DRAFT_586822, partial [Fennellomyces sp. T-0311]